MKEIKLSRKAKALKAGVYEHFKEGKYQVLGVVIHSETLEEMVLYQALYGKKLTWVRPLKMFLEKVKADGRLRPRFKLVRTTK